MIAVTGTIAFFGFGAWILLPIDPQITPVPTAQEVLQQACETMNMSDYDEAATGTDSSGTVQEVFSYRISGNDFHLEGTIYSSEGVVSAQGEVIAKNGVMYVRGIVFEEGEDTWSEWNILDRPPLIVGPLPCFDTKVDASAIEVEGNSVASERHLVWTYPSTGSPPEMKKEEIWVDSTGRPIRGRITITEPSGTDANVAAMADDEAVSTFEVVTITDFVYSGFGEPNMITTPIQPPTPTATPEPTPTPPPTLAPTPTPRDQRSSADPVA